MIPAPDWNKCATQDFWGEIAPCDHVVQVYEDEAIFLDALAGFVGDGINSGDSVLLIATDEHLKILHEHLRLHGIHVDALIYSERYILMEVDQALPEFMVDGWPDEALFMEFVSGLYAKARKENRRVRIFGEMVAVLWERGQREATIHLEHLWNKFCQQETFSLFCAYPKKAFLDEAKDEFLDICCAHTKMIAGSHRQIREIHYRNIDHKKAV